MGWLLIGNWKRRDRGGIEEGKRRGERKGREAGREEAGKRKGNRKRERKGERKGERNHGVREGGASGIASHDILPHAYDSVLIIPLSRFCGVVAYALCEVRVCQQPYDSVGQSLC